jgi:hypothetical protein
MREGTARLLGIACLSGYPVVRWFEIGEWHSVGKRVTQNFVMERFVPEKVNDVEYKEQ